MLQQIKFKDLREGDMVVLTPPGNEKEKLLHRRWHLYEVDHVCTDEAWFSVKELEGHHLPDERFMVTIYNQW